MEYFKHDINASEDDKICELLANGGYEMLGYYWRFVEYLYSRGGKVYKTKLNSISWSLHMDFDKLKDLISNYDLFCEDEECIFSKRVLLEVEGFEAVGKRMAEIGRLGGQASAKAKGKADCQAYGKAYAKPNGEAYGEACGKAYAKQNKKNKIKEKKENKKNKENGFALSGNLPDGYTKHSASGEIYTVIDGEMYNLDGQKLNSAGFLDIENL